MPFVRRATLEDLPALASFDEWNAATEQRIESGQCFVAGLRDHPLAFGILDRSFMNRSSALPDRVPPAQLAPFAWW